MPGERIVVARHMLTSFDEGSWRDVREAKPRCRGRLTEGDVGTMTVYDDGSIEADPNIELDFYEGDEFEDIRNEEIVVGVPRNQEDER